MLPILRRFPTCRQAVLLTLALALLETVHAQSPHWQPLNGPGSGALTVLLITPNSTLFAGTDSAGIFRSTDEGLSWIPSNTGLADLHISVLVADQSGTLFAGSRSRFLFRSTNGGLSWDTAGFSTGPVTALAVAPNGQLFAGTDFAGLYRSTNGGDSFSRVDFNEFNTVPIRAILVTPHYDIIAAGGDYIKWLPLGETFWHYTFGGANGVRSFCLSPFNRVFVGADGVYYMTDSLMFGGVVPDGLFGQAINSIAINNFGRIFAATNDSGVYESLYNGETWSPVRSGLPGAAITSLALRPDGYLFAASSDGVVYRSELSTNGILPPQKVAPPDDTLDVRNQIRLKWRSSIGAASYRVQVSTDSLFASGIFLEESLNDTSISVSGLEDVTRYEWRVRAESGNDTSSYSHPWRFVTGPPPAAPVLLSPPDSASNQPTSIRLAWHPVPNAVGYTVVVSYVPDFSPPWPRYYAASDTVFSVSGLLTNSIYYWRVSASNIAGTGEYSVARSFGTITPPQLPPLLTGPEIASADLPTSVTLGWSAAPQATSYDLQISTEDQFLTGLILSDSTITTTSRTVSGLANGTTYLWRVRGRNVWGVGPFTSPWWFTTIVQAPPAPSLLSPPNGAGMLPTTNIRLVWSSSPRATRYTWDLATDSLFAHTVGSEDISDTTISFSYLTDHTEFYWRISAANQGGTSPWSEVHHFGTVDEGNGRPGVPPFYYITDNFPNPFNPTTSFLLGLPVPTQVSIKIYNISGVEIATIEDAYLPGGYYFESWTAMNVPSGVYYCVTRAGDLIARKRMLLLK
jgi:fibronectin type III domain protein/WD40 domain-containing protein